MSNFHFSAHPVLYKFLKNYEKFRDTPKLKIYNLTEHHKSFLCKISERKLRFYVGAGSKANYGNTACWLY